VRIIGSTIGGGKSAKNTPQLSNEKRTTAKSNQKATKTTKSVQKTADSSSLDQNSNEVEVKTPDVGEVRRARAEFYDTPPELRQRQQPDRRQRDAITNTEDDKMPYVVETVVRQRIPEEDVRYYPRKSNGDKDRSRRDEAETRPSRRKVRVTDEDEYVYRRPREEAYSMEEDDDIPSGSRSRHTYASRESHRQGESTSRRRSTPVDTSRSSRRRSTKTESRRSSYKDDTPARRNSTRDEPRRRIYRDGVVYETRPVNHVKERLIPLRHQSEPIWRSGNPGRRGSESAVEQVDRHDRPKVGRCVFISLFIHTSTPLFHPMLACYPSLLTFQQKYISP
jgi:hypothetical protein